MRFTRVAEHFDRLEEISSRLAMLDVLADLFREAEAGEVDKIIYLAQGRLLPAFVRLEFGVGEALLREAITTATGTPVEEVRRRFAAVGDYGTLAAELLAARPDGEASVAEVYESLYAVATAAGKGAQAQKKAGVVELLARVGARGAKHVCRILLGRLRLGIGDPTVMDGLSFARTGSKADRPALERAYNLCSDLGLVARTYLEGGPEALAAIRVQVGRPVRPELAERAAGPEELIKRLGRCAVEPKIDGFRCQVHLGEGAQAAGAAQVAPQPEEAEGPQEAAEAAARGIHAYSRNLEDFSDMFPEIVEAIREQARGHTVIVDGEAVGYDPATLEFHPFQVTVQRRRKYDIGTMRQSLPLKLLAFDLLYLDGEDLTPRPYLERRERLVALLGTPIDFAAPGAATGPAIQPNDMRILEDVAEVEAFFATTVERGQEGIVAKRLEAPYQAGARNFNWIKLKRSYRGELKDTVDCVVVGYWYGKGHRARLGIGALLTAVYDPERDVFTTVTRLGSGFTEEEWVRLKEMLDEIREPRRPARVDSLLEPDVWCLPRYVVEIQADEITRSPMHTTGRQRALAGAGAGGETGPTPTGEEGQAGEAPTSGAAVELGYALRFPRAVGFLRADRVPEDATTVAEVIDLYRKQGRRAVDGGGA